MARYHVEELYGEEVVTSRDADANDALAAVEGITGKAISPRTLQQHWFRVIDEGGSAYEFCVDEDPQTVDFAK
ncbi:hypothetical protein D3227_28100 [Mesorhizobium waimense]|uniref:Uncharacterized protein n=1 Tax=Mesorhizobium waimense TaxID=1300307 RepID=A0A3A5K8Q6_9HYPH|nr:hypothetical protein [Mesorhizobium waimense]RJT31900.1 hypothetical protein D3227_28100 [Mesorhizobium waimense]